MIDPHGAEPFDLASGIDPDELRRSFARDGVVQLQPFLGDRAATALRDHLAGRTDWTRAIKAAASAEFEHRLRESPLSPAQGKALETLAATSSGPGFAYVYDRIVAVGRQGERPEAGTPLARFAAFLERPATLGLLAAICGDEEIDAIEAQATRYGPGHFLTLHYDWETGSSRRIAYVFGLTEGWRDEWGGALRFHDRSGAVVRSFLPRMNALTLFGVPRGHSVGAVAEAAGAPRYSITGWLTGPPRDRP